MEEQPEVARFYRVKKFTRYLGRFPDGTKIWGGPYNMTQGVVGAIAGLIAMQTNELWGTGNIFFDLLLGGGTVYLIVRMAGRIRTGNRNPASLLLGLYAAMTAPSTGMYNGAPPRDRTPRQVSGRVLMTPSDPGLGNRPPVAPVEVLDQEQSGLQVVSQQAPAPERPGGRPDAVTAVERLLAQSKSK